MSTAPPTAPPGEARTHDCHFRLSPRERAALDALAAARATTRTRALADLLLAAAPRATPAITATPQREPSRQGAG